MSFTASGNFGFPFIEVDGREEPIVNVHCNNLVHVQLQPHLNEPPGTIDAGYLAGIMHLKSGLMKQMVDTTQKIFSERDDVSFGQIFGYPNIS